jgi:hypothetical protein
LSWSLRQGAERRHAGGEHGRRKIPTAKSKASGDRTSIDTFEDRFPTLQFADRFPAAHESLPQVQRQVALAPQPPRTVRTEP